MSKLPYFYTMTSIVVRMSFFLMLHIIVQHVCAQCNPVLSTSHSSRIANHTIKLTLDHKTKIIKAKQTLVWKNMSPVPVGDMQLYTYLNSFKNSESSFIKTSNGNPFGQNLISRPADSWGWIHIDNIETDEGVSLNDNMRYIQLDDGNVDDESVALVEFPNPIQPGESISLDIEFTVKVPKTIARVGYSRDFFLLVHWFPQPGVWELTDTDEWKWNCHQGHRRTEFFNEFGNYDVEITCSDKMVLGASGCEVSNIKNDNGTQTVTYRGEDIHSFAWSAYPHFEKTYDQWKHVEITLLSPPEHRGHAYRFVEAVKNSLEYLEKHVGPYPYPSITIMNPPFHGLRSGFMEYPTFITTGSAYGFPKGVRTIESLAVHEFAHQYFMGMVASNEKEEPWLDEGFVTYLEDEIMETYYGEKTSLFDILGYKVGNSELSRNEYISLPNPSVGTINRPAWEFEEGRKGLIYSKSACILKTIKNYIGQENMDVVMKDYFSAWSFKHPKTEDFMASFEQSLLKTVDSTLVYDMLHFLDEGINTTKVIDYSVASIQNSKQANSFGIFDKKDSDGVTYVKGELIDDYTSSIVLYKFGELSFPVDIKVVFENGDVVMEEWDGISNRKTFRYEGQHKIVTAIIDPLHKLRVDLDYNNNSYALIKEKKSLWKYGLKAINWVQHTLQSVSFLL